jgi:FlaA1/EpsC-like NDP-sugar epimerase
MAARLFPRWGILLIDLLLCLAGLATAYLLRFNFTVPPHEVDLLLPVLPLFLLVRAVSFLLAGIPRQMVRHTGTDDARRIFLTVLAGSAVFGLISVLRYRFVDGLYFLPRAVIIIDFMATAMLLLVVRIGFKLLHLRVRGAGKERVRVIVHGAGEAGLITKRTLEREGSARYAITAFVDDDERKVGKRLEGVPVHHTSRLADLLARDTADQVIIAIARPDPEQRRRVVETCLAAKTTVLSIPPVRDWIHGQLSAGQIRSLRIEDLLGRPVIELDQPAVAAMLKGKRVLVTGAAGSIGGELSRQLAELDTTELVLLDHAESPLYDLHTALIARGHANLIPVVADVRDKARLRAVMERHRPEVVFHAAAYKHVPLMEAQPAEAVVTNVLGTRHLAELSCALGVERFVLISTDKAVNPTSVMGASKRVAELVVSALGRGCATRFITTRFGNVLGSNGSVVPLFQRQIEHGGPVTVTHPEVTRFFMTIPEACRLVLEASAMGEGGQIHVFDMGAPVRIADLAEKMIRLSGHEPGRDIAIAFTGLRPGEKLYEELLATAENTLPTHHPRILIAKVREADPTATLAAVDHLVSTAVPGREHDLLDALHRLVPEYREPNGGGDTFAPRPESPLEAQGRTA